MRASGPIDRAALVLCVLALAAVAGTARAAERPNFVFVLVDDVSSWDDLGCYGAEDVRTPHIDRLASEGLVFDNAYLTASSCSPSRCSILTGRYPHNTGAGELHMPLPADQPMFPQRLREAGYYTALSGKNHMGAAAAAAFDEVSGAVGPGGAGDWVRVLRERPREKPFFCWFASTDAHRDWQLSEHAPRYAPENVRVPPFLLDGPETRADLAGYLHEVSRIDHFVGEVSAELARQGVERDTYVILCSDNGRPFPRCKTRLYDSGIKTPLVIWRPGAIPEGRSTALVSAVDLAPTVLELAGVAPDPRTQGVSMGPLLEDPAARIRDYVFAEHNWHVYQAHERMVRSGDLVYIRNAWPERQNLCVESTDRFPAGAELWRAEAEGRLEPHQRDVFRVPRSAEELYDLSTDPDQLRDLSGAAELEDDLLELRAVLDRWILETGDSVPGDPTPDRGSSSRGEDTARRGEQPGEEHGARERAQPGPILRGVVHLANGIKIGEVTATSAIVWTRLTRHPERNAGGTPFRLALPASGQLPEGRALDEMEGAVPGAAGEVRLTHWPAGRPGEVVTTPWRAVDVDADHTHRFLLEDLIPGARYRLLLEGRAPGARSVACRLEGSFSTTPAADAFAPVSFCVITGQDYHRRDDPDGGHRIYGSMLAPVPDFLVHTGDAVYYDKPRPFAGSVALARFKWSRIYGLPLQRELHRTVPAYFLKDDHDTLRNDCWPGQRYGELTWERGVELYREQNPVGMAPYRTVRWGRDLQLWFVEGREFRSPNTQPDGPEKTIWGEEQKCWLFESLSASTATFRILVSPTPIVGPDRPTKNDNHANAGFAHEGREVRRFLASQEGALVICGDRHWQYVSADPETGLREYSCGPTSDAHAGGFRQADRSAMHAYLNVVGGFLRVAVDGTSEAPRLVLQHRGTDGEVLHEEILGGR